MTTVDRSLALLLRLHESSLLNPELSNSAKEAVFDMIHSAIVETAGATSEGASMMKKQLQQTAEDLTMANKLIERLAARIRASEIVLVQSRDYMRARGERCPLCHDHDGSSDCTCFEFDDKEPFLRAEIMDKIQTYSDTFFQNPKHPGT